MLLSVIWLGAAVAGTRFLLVYDFTPGREGTGKAPSHWPAASEIPHAAALPTLVMFAHPKCPCTRASMGELALLMAHCQGLVDARVVFFQPEGSGEDWSRTDLWRTAAAIPGVTVQADEGGAEATRFHATTSGQTILYDARGDLLFNGGITDGRGHSGDNAGRSAIIGLLNHRTAAVRQMPAFGCSLLDPETN